jgi:hypothetical protein
VAATPIFAEEGDAGQLPGTAQDTVSFEQLQGISGTIGNNPTLPAANDVDLFAIIITNPAAFSATTVGTGGTLADTQLFLFDADGRGVIANDDASAAISRSTIPAVGAGRPARLGPTTPGLYYLGIAAFDRDPVSSTGLIFPSFPLTTVFGPTGPGGADPVSDYAGAGTGTGTYLIALTGAAPIIVVPEPTSLTLLSVGALGALGRGWRRKRAA